MRSFDNIIKTYDQTVSIPSPSYLQTYRWQRLLNIDHIFMPPFLKRIEEWRVLLTHLGTALVLWAAGNLLLKHLYHSRHQALNCIEIVGNHVATKGLKNACLHQFQNLITIKLIMTSALKALGKRRRGGKLLSKDRIG